MKILVCGSDSSRKEVADSLHAGSTGVEFVENWKDASSLGQFEALFFLDRVEVPMELLKSDKPVFVNEVIATLDEMQAPGNVIRINGWPGFLRRNVWEAAGNINERARSAAAAIGKELVSVKDTPGLVAAAVVCTVINEAFFALHEGLSSKDEIDIAMKAATNYPHGPFEWGALIGSKNVHELLRKLSENNEKYTPSFVPDSI